jgi:hypothetical protein
LDLQKQVNLGKERQIDLEEQVKVLSGEIVGYNNGRAVYASEATAGQYQYQSPSEILAARLAASGKTGSTTTSSSQSSSSTSPFVSLNAPNPYANTVSKSTAKSLVPADSYSAAPAASSAGSSVTLNGGITISLPNITTINDDTADQLARAVYARLKQFDKRYA